MNHTVVHSPIDLVQNQSRLEEGEVGSAHCGCTQLKYNKYNSKIQCSRSKMNKYNAVVWRRKYHGGCGPIVHQNQTLLPSFWLKVSTG